MRGFRPRSAAGGPLFSLFALALVASAALSSGSASAATVRVMNCNDRGVGSLRDAVARARSGDIIDLTRLGCRRIVLTSGQIDIAQQAMTLVGPGRSKLMLDGNKASPVLLHYSEEADHGVLTVKSMTIARGSGRCIIALGRLDLLGSDVHHCDGGGVLADQLRLVDSRLFRNDAGEDYGGGAAAWSISIYRSQVFGNRAAEGGGLWAAANISVTYSSVNANRSIHYGGGIHAPYGTLRVNKSTVANNRTSNIYTGRGGGAWAQEVHVYDSTFSGNVANSASALLAWGGVRINNSTIVFNREMQTDPTSGGAVVVHRFETARASAAAAIAPTALYTISSSIIARNQTNGMPGKDLGPDFYVVGGSNLIERASIPLPADTLSANPLLGPLADNGGPTRTHALRNGSPAIDRGNNRRNRQYDQRGPGFVRVRGKAPDIGALEHGR